MKANEIIIALVCVVIIGELKISISPFKIHLEKPYTLVGILLVTIGVSCMAYQYKKQWYRKGIEDTINTIKETEKGNSI